MADFVAKYTNYNNITPLGFIRREKASFSRYIIQDPPKFNYLLSSFQRQSFTNGMYVCMMNRTNGKPSLQKTEIYRQQQKICAVSKHAHFQKNQSLVTITPVVCHTLPKITTPEVKIYQQQEVYCSKPTFSYYAYIQAQKPTRKNNKCVTDGHLWQINVCHMNIVIILLLITGKYIQ